jgi:putative ABC transport system permease protein
MTFIFETLLQALKGLQQHTLRTFLTMLGVIFGVAAVIGMLSIGKGAEQEAIEQIAAFGINNVRIHALELTPEQQDKAARTPSKGLTYEDAQYLQDVLPYIDAVAPQNLIEKEVVYQQLRPQANLVGTTPGYLDVNGQKPGLGRFLTDDDLREYRQVCVLSYALAQELFLTEDPLGQYLTLGGMRFRVVGVLAERTQTAQKIDIKSRNTDRDIYIPITTSLRKFTFAPSELNLRNSVDYNVVDEIALKVSDASFLRESRDSISQILDRRHANIPDYQVVVPTELLEQSQQTQRLFNLVMGCIAGLSLLVGGIGIMNIMLASVTERTREIGIRRAIGARPADVLLFFLLEATLISLIGGVIGIFTGMGISALVSLYAGWKTIVSVESILLSFGVSSLVGIFFGLYPAWRASKMDPIQALRHE